MKRGCVTAVLMASALDAQTLGGLLRDGIVVGGGGKKGAATQPPAASTPPASTSPAAAPAPTPATGDPGFRMNLPPGWRAQLLQSGAVIGRSADQNSLILIGPLNAPAGMTAQDWLRRSAAASLQNLLPGAQLSGVFPSRLGRGGAMATFDYRSAAGPGKATMLCFLSGSAGAAYVIAAPAASFTQQRPGMIAALRSFQFTGVTERRAPAAGGAAAPAVQLSFRRFSDPNENSFSVDVPVNWQVQGGTIRKNSVDVRSAVRLQSPDNAIAIVVGDTNIGTFCEPSQTLAMTGFREGSQYSPGYGTVMIIRRYIPGVQFAQEYAGVMARGFGASSLQMREAKQRPDLSQSNPNINQASTAGEVAFTSVRNGQENAGYVLASTSRMALPGDTGIWNVITLVGWMAPPSATGTVNAVLDRLMRSFQINAQWARAQQQLTADTSRIVTETNNRVSQIITDSYWSRQRSQDRTSENFSDYIRGRVRLKDPETGEELEGTAGKNYYWRQRGTNTIVGSDTPDRPTNIDVTELEQIG